MAQEKKIRRVAGRVGWIAGFVPWAKAFSSILYAAAHCRPEKWSERTAKRRSKRPDLRFMTKPAEMALRWTRTLLRGDRRDAAGECVPLSRTFTVRTNEPHGPALTIRCDASPWGFGGLLLRNGQVVSFWADKITDADRKVIPGEAGDPAFQAEWELFAILISLVVWEARMADAHVACLESDSQAALYACARWSSNTPSMNLIAAEIGLRVIGSRIELSHVSGVANYEADALSRLCQGKPMPQHLEYVERKAAPKRDASFFLAWAKEFAG